jgi:hypothetical protein
MPNTLNYSTECAGQTFTIRIDHPKAQDQYRGYMMDALNVEQATGRWTTLEEADGALKAIASNTASRKKAV